MIARQAEEAVLTWVFLLTGCSLLASRGGLFQRTEGGREAAERAVVEGDRFFLQRADPDKLDAAIDSWQAGLLEAPEDPVLLGRLAMAYTLRAEGRSAHRPEGYIVAREHGIRCLKTEPFLAGRFQTYGGRLDPRGLREVDVDLVPCLTWTSLAWSRWLADHGAAGAALDLEIVIALAEKAYKLDAEYDRSRPRHALGLAIALTPAPLEPDLDRAELLLQQAAAAAPERYVISVDLAEFVHGARGNGAAYNRTLAEVVGSSPDAHPQLTEENEASISRANALLARGPQPTWGLPKQRRKAAEVEPSGDTEQ